MNTCVLCSNVSITTAAHIPVCLEHWREYKNEAERYLPLSKREIYQRLIMAYERQTEEPYYVPAKMVEWEKCHNTLLK